MRKRSFNQLMIIGPILAGRLERDTSEWPRDATYWTGLARITRITMLGDENLEYTAQDEEQFQWWEHCQDDEAWKKACEVLDSLIQLGFPWPSEGAKRNMGV